MTKSLLRALCLSVPLLAEAANTDKRRRFSEKSPIAPSLARETPNTRTSVDFTRGRIRVERFLELLRIQRPPLAH